MNSIIISINPKHVKNILNGTKKYEYRTIKAKKKINKIIIYETSPIKKIVAEVELIEILENTPSIIWQSTKNFSGIDKDFFDNYFKNRNNAYAYKLGEIKKYDRPKKLSDFGLTVAPQSFVYI